MERNYFLVLFLCEKVIVIMSCVVVLFTVNVFHIRFRSAQKFWVVILISSLHRYTLVFFVYIVIERFRKSTSYHLFSSATCFCRLLFIKLLIIRMKSSRLIGINFLYLFSQ